MKDRLTDYSGVSALALGVGSLTVTDLLQISTLCIGLVCGMFSLYFHIKRFIHERKQNRDPRS